MLDLIARLIGIVLLRLGPQDLPGQWSAALASLVLYVLVSALNLTVGNPHPQPVVFLGLAVILPLAASRIVLDLRGVGARWRQTVAALFGTSAVLSLLTLPLTTLAGDGVSPLAAVVLLLAFFWSFAVDAHIWRNALQVGFSLGLLVAVLIFAFTLTVIRWLTGPV